MPGRAHESKAADIVLARAREQFSAPGITEISYVGDVYAAELLWRKSQGGLSHCLQNDF